MECRLRGVVRTDSKSKIHVLYPTESQISEPVFNTNNVVWSIYCLHEISSLFKIDLTHWTKWLYQSIQFYAYHFTNLQECNIHYCPYRFWDKFNFSLSQSCSYIFYKAISLTVQYSCEYAYSTWNNIVICADSSLREDL